MPTLNLLSVETVGVDMKTNPALLGNRKLHAATNLVFAEGVIRTRPGIRYQSLGLTGQFQGACLYRPQSGLSSGVFSDTEDGLVLAVSGDLYYVEKNICETPCRSVRLTRTATYKGKGVVHLFQAENYAVAQNTDAVTMWWDGAGTPVISQGMVEQEWTDPETPWEDVNEEEPVADIPDCDPPEQPWQVEYLVLNADTLFPIPGAAWNADRLGVTKFSGFSDTDAKFTFTPKERRYSLHVDAAGFFPYDNWFTYRRPQNAENRDDCYEINAADRTVRYTIYLTPFVSGEPPPVPPVPNPDPDPEPVCGFVIEDVWMGTPGNPTLPGDPGYNAGPFYYGEFTVRNTGTVVLTILSIEPSNSLPEESVWTPPLPVNVAAGESVTVTLTTPSWDIADAGYTVNTSCGSLYRSWWSPDGIIVV